MAPSPWVKEFEAAPCPSSCRIVPVPHHGCQEEHWPQGHAATPAGQRSFQGWGTGLGEPCQSSVLKDTKAASWLQQLFPGAEGSCSLQLSLSTHPHSSSSSHTPHPCWDEHRGTHTFPSLPATTVGKRKISSGTCHQEAHLKSCLALTEGRRSDPSAAVTAISLGPAPSSSPAPNPDRAVGALADISQGY